MLSQHQNKPLVVHRNHWNLSQLSQGSYLGRQFHPLEALMNVSYIFLGYQLYLQTTFDLELWKH